MSDQNGFDFTGMEPRLYLSLAPAYIVPGDFTGDNDVDLDDFCALKAVIIPANPGINILANVEAMRINWGPATGIPISADPYIGNDAATYTRIVGSLFVDGAAPEDVRQGKIGDCYFLAVLAALADTDPDLMTHHIALLGDGTFIARFAFDGEPEIIRMNVTLPTIDGKLLFAKTPGGELWVALYERAFAEARYHLSSYPSLNAGWPSGAFDAILDDPGQSEWVVNIDPATDIPALLDAGYAVTLASRVDASSPVIGNHVYAVTGADADGLETYNPHGHYVTFTWAEIQAGFRLVTAVQT